MKLDVRRVCDRALCLRVRDVRLNGESVMDVGVQMFDTVAGVVRTAPRRPKYWKAHPVPLGNIMRDQTYVLKDGGVDRIGFELHGKVEVVF